MLKGLILRGKRLKKRIETTKILAKECNISYWKASGHMKEMFKQCFDWGEKS